MTHIHWRALLAPIGLAADRRATVYGLARGVVLAGLGTPPLTTPRELQPVLFDQQVVGVVDELAIDGDPQVLRAGGYLPDPAEDLLRQIRDKRVHVGFDLTEVVSLGYMVTAAKFSAVTLTAFDHPTDPYALWYPETFTATFELVD